MSVSIPSLGTPVSQKTAETGASSLPDIAQFNILSFLPRETTKGDTNLNHGVMTVLHGSMSGQKAGTIYPTILHAIDSGVELPIGLNRSLQGKREWYPASKAQMADTYVTHLIQKGRIYLTVEDWAELRISESRLTKSLTMQEKARVVEKINERNGKLLISFFRELSPYVSEVEQFLAHMDAEATQNPKTVEEKGGLIRSWMRAHEALLKTGDPIAFNISLEQIIPPEITFIFPRLTEDEQVHAIRNITTQGNTSAFRAMIGKYKNDPVLGPKILAEFFRNCALQDSAWIEELRILPEILALPPFITTFGSEEPSDWFYQSLQIAARSGNEEIVRAMGKMDNGALLDQDEFNRLFGSAARLGMESVIIALGEWPQAGLVNLDYLGHPTTENLEILLEWAIEQRNIDVINALKDWPGSHLISKRSFKEFLAIAEDFGQPVIEALNQWPQNKQVDLYDHWASDSDI